MKTSLENEDIQAMATALLELLKPLIASTGKSGDDDILDVQGLADYLKVKKQWVYERVHYNTIPHYKVGKYPRFRKSEIDQWLQTMERGKGRKPTKTVRRLLEDTP